MEHNVGFELMGILTILYLVAMVAIGITLVVLGVKLLLKLLKLIDSKTRLNNERLKQLQNDH